MASLIAELKRRNVFRVAVLYAIVAWLVLQIADVSVSLLGLPPWSGRLVFLLLALGFPVALALAWVFELTPEGLRRERPATDGAHPERRKARIAARKLDILIGATAAIAIAVVAADRFAPRKAPTPSPAARASAATGAARPAPRPSIAVLPFVNVSGDPDNAYFSEGISDELINSLCRLPGLRVIGRTSSFQFQGRPSDLRTIGRTLGVAHVLEGSVRKSGERVRITTQLVSTEDGTQRWSASYDRRLGDVFAVQDSIVDDVVKALRVQLVQQAAHAPRPASGEAYAKVLQGRHWLQRNAGADLGKAEALYREAIRLDPGYADAWAGLAATYYAQTSFAYLPAATGLPRMHAAVAKALALDPDSVAAHHVMAMIQMGYDWDWAAARTSVDRALALAPGDASVIRQAGTLELTLGRFDRAIDLYRQSLDVNPLDGNTLNDLAIAQYYAGRHADAEASLERLEALNPASNGGAYLRGLVLLARDRPADARKAFERDPGEVWRLQGRALSARALGDGRGADAALAELAGRFGEDSAFQVAEVHGFRGEADQAFAWLDRAYRQRDGGLSELKGDPLFAPVARDPRYPAFLRRMRLPAD